MESINPRLIRFLPMVAAIFAIAGAVVWLLSPAEDVGGMGVPKPRPAAAAGEEEKSLTGLLTTVSTAAVADSGSWPGFRGPDRNGIAPDPTPLAKSWPESGPPVIWERDVAKGHAGVVVHHGRVYLHDYDEEGLRDVIRCLSFATGEELWNYSYPITIKTNHGITRSIAAVNDRFVVSIGPKAQVFCLDAVTGAYKWSKSMVLSYQSEVPKWYSAQCPYLQDDNVILAPAGPEKLMVCVDAETGEEKWAAANALAWTMTHASIVPMKLHGRATYVYTGSGGIAGVDAETGQVLWDSVKWKIKIAACASPTVIDGERLFLCAGYGVGSMMMKIDKTAAGGYSAAPVVQLTEKQFGSVQHTPIFFDGVLYGVRPNGELVCLDLDGNIRWSSGKERFGLGPFLLAQGMLYVMNDDGTLTMVKVSKEKYEPVTSARILKGHDSWGLMALVDGRLFARDFDHLVCVDLSAAGNSSK